MNAKSGVYCIVFGLVYLLFAQKAAWDEMTAAVFAGFIGTVVLKISGAHTSARFHIRGRWIGLLLRRVPLQALTDCLLVLAVLLKYLIRRTPMDGRFVRVPFNSGGDDPESTARRALVIAAVSFSPNSIAVLVDREEGFLLVHQLEKTIAPPGGGDKEWPL